MHQLTCIKFSVLALLLLLPFSTLSQTDLDYQFQHYQREDGLSHSIIYSIVQDNMGFLWLGGREGLNRFDGYTIKTYFHNPEDPLSIPHDSTGNLLITKDGTLWIGSWGGGLIQRDAITGQYQQYLADPTVENALSGNKVQSIYEDSKGNLWIGTYRNGLNKFNRTTKTFNHFHHNPKDSNSLSNDRVWAITEDKNGMLWIATDNGLNQFNPTNQTFKHYFNDPANPQSLSQSRVRALFFSASAGLWVGTQNGINLWQPETQSFQRLLYVPENGDSFNTGTITSITEDHAGALWIGTGRGLVKYVPTTGQITRVKHNPNDSYSLPADRVRWVFEDRSNVIWVSTAGSGVSKFNNETKRFNHHAPLKGKAGMSSRFVTSLYEDQVGNIWIGSLENGISIFNPKAEDYRQLRHDPEDKNSLNHDFVYAIYGDFQGKIWIGTSKGISQYNPQTGIFESYRKDNKQQSDLPSREVTTFLEDSQKGLWIGTKSEGLFHFDYQSSTFRHIDDKSNVGPNRGYSDIHAIYEDSKGNIWIATENGLKIYDGSADDYLSIVDYLHHDTSWAFDDVSSIKEDKDGLLWVGTRGGGLHKYNANTGETVNISTTSGLSDNTVNSIVIDLEGSLWVSTNNGLSKVNPKTLNIKSYDVGDGLQSKEFNLGASLIDRSGKIYFGGINGFNVFEPEKIDDDNSHYPILISEFKKFNKPVSLNKEISHISEITLPYTDNFFGFEFASVDFSAPDKIQYAYKMDGFDKDWNYIKRKHEASYTNLDPGSYTFKVKASNKDGIWNDTEKHIQVTITPSPWRSNFAYSLYAVLVLCVIALYLRLQQQKLSAERKLNQRLEVQVLARTEQLAEKNEQLLDANKKLETISFTDQLTGAYNRRFLENTIEHETAQIDRNLSSNDSSLKHNSTISFLIIDLDFFKNINDIYGHETGDRVLVDVVKLLKEACRKADWVVRWGGEEFVVVARNVKQDELCSLAERIKSNIEAHSFVSDNHKRLQATCSIGIASYPFITESPETLSWRQSLNIADTALYTAKHSGRNAWVLLQAGQVNEAEELYKNIMTDISALIEQGELSYQTSKLSKPLCWQ